MSVSRVLITRTSLRGLLLVRRLRASGEWLLERLGSSEELSILLTDDGGIRELNRQHRQIDTATDVLSFSQREGAAQMPPLTLPQLVRPPQPLLGDVVISLQTARRTRGRGALAEEVRRLLVHGLLHLLGYDHEDPPRDDEPMLELQEQLVAELTMPDRSGNAAAIARNR